MYQGHGVFWYVHCAAGEKTMATKATIRLMTCMAVTMTGERTRPAAAWKISNKAAD